MCRRITSSFRPVISYSHRKGSINYSNHNILISCVCDVWGACIRADLTHKETNMGVKLK